MDINVVLVEPEIPQNTGNISRTCVATGTTLHLIKPLGFSLDEKHLKRAGLDYWNLLNIELYDNIEHFYKKNRNGNFFYASTKAINSYTDINYKDKDKDKVFFIFGKETAGLNEELLKDNKERCIRIPMCNKIRSLNLSNSVAIVIYEALRQESFQGLERAGNLTKYDW